MDIQNRLPSQNLTSPADAGNGLMSGGGWPTTQGTHIVFLLDARDRFEAVMLEQWARQISEVHPVKMDFVRLGTRQTQSRLANILGQAWLTESSALQMPALWFQPLRIAWFSRSRGDGVSSFGSDLFYGRITQPGYWRRRWIAKNDPERMRVIEGVGAWTADIHANYQARPERNGAKPGAQRSIQVAAGSRFTDWVQEQAYLVLELAERVARGARYKIARLLPHQVFSDGAFQRQLVSIADEDKLPLTRVQARAERYLREMAASQSPFTVDLITALYRAGARSSHDPIIDVVAEQLAQVATMMHDRPVIFLISHKSMLDTCAFSLVLFDANLPIPLTFGGINLSTPGVGALARRAGIIFLRRSFQDNAIYKTVFRRYIDHLIEKRFSLLWALEGTRSRTGKLLPPRFGLFNYVVESILRTRLLNAAFVPVTVAYDQIVEVEDYAIEQRGSSKKAEGMGWMLRFFKRGKSHGKIFVRFGQSISLPDLGYGLSLPPDMPEADRSSMSQTLAFEVALQMNKATPVTATAVITLILLASGTRAMTLQEIQLLARSAAIFIRRRHIELVGHSDFRRDVAVRATLGQLHETGIVSYHDDGIERLYSIRPEQHHKAAYYRNTAIHHFLVDALVEMSLLMTADTLANRGLESGTNRSTDPAEIFVDLAVRLRGVFKFEFYFSRKPRFREEVVAYANDRFPGWRTALSAGKDAPDAVARLMRSVRPLVAHGVFRSFVDAYVVVASQLASHGRDESARAGEFVSNCLKLGKQKLLQDKISSPESVSKTLYQTGYKLIEHRGLTQTNQSEQRQAFESLLKQAARSLDAIVGLTVADDN
ncbi:MAG: 1-acyl-sn-glycerol-3-phosphate acyltransferase [Burkholderiaceae bacterium]